MKKYPFIFILLGPLLFHAGCSSDIRKQDDTHIDFITANKSITVKDSLPTVPIDSFNRLFTDTAFKTLHVFNYDPYTQISSDYPPSSNIKGHPKENLRFEGNLIQAKFINFLKDKALDSVTPPAYYATYSFQLSPPYTAYLIRVLFPPGPHTLNELRLYTYINKGKRFTKQFEIVANTDDKDYSYKSESWISDPGKADKKIVYTRSLIKEKRVYS